MKKRNLISITIIIAFLIFCFVSLNDSLTPYVTFAQAKTAGNVQVKGVLASKIMESPDKQGIKFILRDEKGEEAEVIYQGSRINNLDHSESVVVIGAYQDKQFIAEKILVKCPSKYKNQGSVK